MDEILGTFFCKSYRENKKNKKHLKRGGGEQMTSKNENDDIAAVRMSRGNARGTRCPERRILRTKKNKTNQGTSREFSERAHFFFCFACARALVGNQSRKMRKRWCVCVCVGKRTGMVGWRWMTLSQLREDEPRFILDVVNRRSTGQQNTGGAILNIFS